MCHCFKSGVCGSSGRLNWVEGRLLPFFHILQSDRISVTVILKHDPFLVSVRQVVWVFSPETIKPLKLRDKRDTLYPGPRWLVGWWGLIFLPISERFIRFPHIYIVCPQESWQWAAGILRASSHLQRLLRRAQPSWRHLLCRVIPQGK